MNHSHCLIVVAVCVACGGRTTSNGSDAATDATTNAAEAGPQCHGYCPQPNGSSCTSDCDCYEKCLAGTCSTPNAANIVCGDDASACPSGEHCGVMGTCEGATCVATADCPPQQQCVSNVCTFFGCL